MTTLDDLHADVLALAAAIARVETQQRAITETAAALLAWCEQYDAEAGVRALAKSAPGTAPAAVMAQASQMRSFVGALAGAAIGTALANVARQGGPDAR